uniref:Galectin n=1 Tax=Sinocyclocheilus grahami TaxID=75366 RepID=A0A672N564_SINGR
MGLSLSNPVQNPVSNRHFPGIQNTTKCMALYLQGVVPANADRFELNFKTGPSDNDDIAFDFNPRMDQKVVMNSFRNGGWEAEESVSDNPFKKGQPFEMFTVIKSEGYQVYVNGKELYTFKHRIPLEKVSTLNISGDVAVTISGFIQVSYFFLQLKQCCTMSDIVTVSSENGLEGEVLSKGVFPTNADQFELNFKTGPSDNDDIAFHFNPRMDQKVVMNSFRNGGWEAEESVSDNPFIKGQPFEMFIVVKSEGYVVSTMRIDTHRSNVVLDPFDIQCNDKIIKAFFSIYSVVFHKRQSYGFRIT